mgnify:CR=1 FL=1
MQRILLNVQVFEKEFARKQMDCYTEDKKKLLAAKRRELSKAKKRIAEIDTLIQKIYEDNASGKLSNERYATLSLSYEEEQKTLKAAVPEMQVYLETETDKTESLQRFIQKVKQITELKALTPELIHEFVDKIVVYAPRYLDGKRVQLLDIYYSGVGILQELTPDEMEEAFQAAAEAGKAIAFREAGDGATTATVPDTAIGGGTAGEYNPARYVNGGFLAVYVRQADGTWCRIASGDTVRVAGPLVIRAVMANTLHTRWLSRTQSDAGYVSLVSAAGSAVRFHLPLAKGVEYLETLEQEFRLCDCVQEEMPVALRFSIEDRFVFGRPFRFQAVPD